MTVRLHLDDTLARAARDHLAGGIDRIGFFLADFDGDVFTLATWRAVGDDELERAPGGHAQLADTAAADVLRWAHQNGAALVEVHSHGLFAPAAFSRIDIAGLAEWVPGVRWRLSGAPYAAVVVAADTVDAWAWIDSSTDPVQVDALIVGGTRIVRATRATLERRDGTADL
jgi:hypothetical protein